MASTSTPATTMTNSRNEDAGASNDPIICESDTPNAEAGVNNDMPRGRKRKHNQKDGITTNKKKSKVWIHFTKFENGEKEQKARCNYCHKEFFVDSTKNGTSSLHNHLRVCKKYKRGSTDPKQTQLTVPITEGEGDLGFAKFDPVISRKALVEMIVAHELPFSFVEYTHFRKFVATLCPSFRFPSRWTIARDCYAYYVERKNELLTRILSSKVSLTTDTWTSVQRVNYMCLTAHFIDCNWTLQKRIINFCPINSHKGEDIGKAIEKCLCDWGIERVFTLTVDNASSNDGSTGYLRTKLNHSGKSVSDGQFLHVRCIAHIINLIVNEGMKEFNVSIARVRAAVKYIRQSPARLTKFKECVELEKIESKSGMSMDVCTRWNSTYLMLEAAQKFERAFGRYEEVDPRYGHELGEGDGVPNYDDWITVRKFCKFLQQFHKVTVKVSGSSYVTTNVFLPEVCDVYSALKILVHNHDTELSVMALKMKTKFDKYWGNVEKMNMLLFVATSLDPRRKYVYVDFAFKRMYGDEQAKVLSAKFRKVVEELFNEYRSATPSTSGNQNSQDKSHQDEVAHATNEDVMDTDDDFVKYVTEELQCVEQRTELDQYISERLEKMSKGDEFEILKWWRTNTHRFPILSSMARDILAIPISTVASESAFSTGGRVLDPYRSSLTPKIVQALICAQDWLRQEDILPIDIGYELDTEELDKVTNDLAKVRIEPVVDH